MYYTIILKVFAVWALCLAAALSIGILVFWIVSNVKLNRLEKKVHGGKVIPFSDEVNRLLDLEDWQLV